MNGCNVNKLLNTFGLIALVLLAACSKSDGSDVKKNLSEDKPPSPSSEKCESNGFYTELSNATPQSRIFELLGTPHDLKDVDITVEISPIFRGHLIELANASASRGEHLIVAEATWHFGECRLTIWSRSDEKNVLQSFSSTLWHKDSQF